MYVMTFHGIQVVLHRLPLTVVAMVAHEVVMVEDMAGVGDGIEDMVAADMVVVVVDITVMVMLMKKILLLNQRLVKKRQTRFLVVKTLVSILMHMKIFLLKQLVVMYLNL